MNINYDSSHLKLPVVSQPPQSSSQISQRAVQNQHLYLQQENVYHIIIDQINEERISP